MIMRSLLPSQFLRLLQTKNTVSVGAFALIQSGFRFCKFDFDFSKPHDAEGGPSFAILVFAKGGVRGCRHQIIDIIVSGARRGTMPLAGWCWLTNKKRKRIVRTHTSISVGESVFTTRRVEPNVGRGRS